MSAQASFINSLLDAAFNGGTYTGGTIKMGLFKTGLPSSGGVEVSGGSYARQTLTFGAASSKKASTSSDATFTNLPSGEEIVAYGIYDGTTLIDERMLSNSYTADVDSNELNISYYFEIPSST